MSLVVAIIFLNDLFIEIMINEEKEKLTGYKIAKLNALSFLFFFIDDILLLSA